MDPISPLASHPSRRLAFVDVETTGLSPSSNRIAEIGVVTVDGARAEHWTTLIRAPGSPAGPRCDRAGNAITGEAAFFRDIAHSLADRLSGRLLIAHNARFDHAFLRAEFDRAGIALDLQVLCSVMLSRRLFPLHPHHDLDSLVERHALRAETRHRALPDADLVWQWWQAIHRQCSHEAIESAIDQLLAGPVLPAQLDGSLVARLPESPGAYVFYDEHRVALRVGAAGNLKLHITEYFRLDHASDKALEHAHRVADIRWHTTRGMIGAKLHAASLERVLFAGSARQPKRAAFTWRFSPDAVPSVSVALLGDGSGAVDGDSYGMFASERTARNALARLSRRHRLCHALLGVPAGSSAGCTACTLEANACACVDNLDRKKQLVRMLVVMAPLRVAAWPHPGPIGIRERSDVHVVRDWHFLGTARSEIDVHGLLACSPADFDPVSYRLLNRMLTRLPPAKLLDLSRYADSAECRASAQRGVGEPIAGSDVDLLRVRSTTNTTRSRMTGNAGATLAPDLLSELEQP
ncbi:MAG: exonuclease domain-containing protein [Betaproteobacteria bacterium]